MKVKRHVRTGVKITGYGFMKGSISLMTGLCLILVGRYQDPEESVDQQGNSYKGKAGPITIMDVTEEVAHTNLMFINNRDGTFRKLDHEFFDPKYAASAREGNLVWTCGADIGDLNGDGLHRFSGPTRSNAPPGRDKVDITISMPCDGNVYTARSVNTKQLYTFTPGM